MDITKNAIWTHDCQGKQDLDFRIIHAFTRYYPDHSAICSMELCPDEAGEGITLCESDIMHGHSEGEIKQMVREWYNAHILDAFKKAIEELGISMEKFYEEYLNGLIAKAKKSWEGVDVDSYMSDLRDDSFDKEVSENLSKEVASYITEQIKSNMDKVTRGGSRPGCGRKPVHPGIKRVQTTISVSQKTRERIRILAKNKNIRIGRVIDRMVEELYNKHCDEEIGNI